MWDRQRQKETEDREGGFMANGRHSFLFLSGNLKKGCFRNLVYLKIESFSTD